MIYFILILILLYYYILLNNKESFHNINNKESFRNINNKSIIISEPGTYKLLPLTEYYFNLSKNNDYIKFQSRKLITLELPSNPKKGDYIKLYDSDTRYSWGNLSYKILVTGGAYPIIGDIKDNNLFLFRQGMISIIWDEDSKSWNTIGKKGIVTDSWSGWYTLKYKGGLFSTDNSASTYVSYMRIDATQNPILITFYGGSSSYPKNIVIKAITAIENKDPNKNELYYPNYPDNMFTSIDLGSRLFKKYKNGVVFDYERGGGWIKQTSFLLNQIPPNLENLS
jgi:hypothetical protein